MSNLIDVHVGNRIRLRRLSVGKTQTQLAQLLKITFQQVQKYERGANRVGASRLLAIADFLQVPASYFFEGLETPSDAATASAKFVSEYFASPDALRLAKAFLSITDPKLRRSIVALVQEIASAYPEPD